MANCLHPGREELGNGSRDTCQNGRALTGKTLWAFVLRDSSGNKAGTANVRSAAETSRQFLSGATRRQVPPSGSPAEGATGRAKPCLSWLAGRVHYIPMVSWTKSPSSVTVVFVADILSACPRTPDHIERESVCVCVDNRTVRVLSWAIETVHLSAYLPICL